MGRKNGTIQEDNKGELERYQFAFFRAMNESAAYEFYRRQQVFPPKVKMQKRRAEHESL